MAKCFSFMYSHFHINSFSHVCKILVIVSGKIIINYKKKSIAECSMLLTFIKLPFVVKTFVLSIYEWPFYTGFTVPPYLKGWFKVTSSLRSLN